MFRFINTQAQNQLIYKPNQFFPEQDGLACYYYTVLRCISLENSSVDTQLALVLKKIISEIHHSTRNLTNIDLEIDDLVNATFKKWLTNEIVQALKQNHSMDDEIVTTQDLIDNYTLSQMTGLLLGLKCHEGYNLREMSYDEYAILLLEKGPIVIDGNFGIDEITPAATSKMIIDSKEFDQHHVKKSQCAGQHCVLLIGCQKLPNTQVFYLDPNFPNIIQTTNFESFKSLVTNFGDQIICSPIHKIKPHVNWQLIQPTDNLQPTKHQLKY